ncbi:MAG: ABC transporter ATP-binding protein [Desulfomonilia bacterium]
MALELQDIHKYFGKTRANCGIDLVVKPGWIHGILGENGAGKSTLMKILAGYIPKTKGRILIEGKEVNYTSPDEASSLGIGMLYQDPMDFPVLTVLDNFMIGQVSGIADETDKFRQQFVSLAREFNFSLRPDTPLRLLTIGERQQLEIIRLLSLGIRVLILDEPTTGISSTQKDVLFTALKKLASEGKSVILVSHKLEDVNALCDAVTVLKDGSVTGTMDKPFDTSALLSWMFGAPPDVTLRRHRPPADTVLVLEHVSASGGRTGLSECSFQVRKGEVIGLAGLEGSGQGVLLRVAAGLIQPKKGTIRFKGRNMAGLDYHAFKDSGIAFLPASRLEEGLIRGLSITEHCALQQYGHAFLVDWQQAHQIAVNRISRFQVTGMPESAVESLSGGNQQRLLLAFLPERPRLLLLENPTRGLDLESVHWVWDHLDLYCEQGAAIVFSSSELDEILLAADRVLVFFEGRIIKDVLTRQTSAMELGRAIAGTL